MSNLQGTQIWCTETSNDMDLRRDTESCFSVTGQSQTKKKIVWDVEEHLQYIYNSSEFTSCHGYSIVVKLLDITKCESKWWGFEFR